MKALITAPFNEEYRKMLEEYMSIEYNNWLERKRPFSEEELVRMASDKDVLIVELDEITANVINKCPNLKIICCCRSGPVNIDIKACTEKGILVLRAPGRNSEAVAEITIAFMIMLSRNIMPASEWMKNKNWNEKMPAEQYIKFRGKELWGNVIGIIGLGEIGTLVAKLLKPFGAQLIGYDPYVSQSQFEELGIKAVDLETLFKSSDIVTVHIPATEETKGLIGKKEFALMKPSAYFINTARAIVVDTKALYNILKERKIAGAAIDVFDKEPTTQDPFLELDNVLTTPHICGATYEVVDHHSSIIYNEIIKLIKGEKPNYPANPEVLLKSKLRWTNDKGKSIPYGV